MALTTLETATTTVGPFCWLNKPLGRAAQLPQPSTWVKLHRLPNPYSFDEALLLCQQNDEHWLAWVPDHGEVVLHEREFAIA